MILSSRQDPTPIEYIIEGLVGAGLDPEDAPYVKSVHIEGHLALVEVLQVTVDKQGKAWGKIGPDGIPVVEAIVLELT